MKSKIFKAFCALFVTGVCVLTLAETASAQVEDWDFAGRRLEGSWTVQVTLRDCTSGAAVGSPFSSLLTFSRGGTLLEATASPMFFPAVRGPGHGVWSHTNHHEFKAVSTAYITMNGVLVRTQTIRQTIEMGNDPDQLKSSATVVFVPADGSATINACASATGKRIE